MAPSGPLDGIRVLDLSRVLAGPTCTQLLGDLGADVIKVERPGRGDDTRKWGPPYVKDADGHETAESAYYLCANRNKRSICIDFTTEQGRQLIVELARRSDVLIENYKVGDLAKHHLAYADLQGDLPGLIYCSISGFGQTGPRRHEPGYDFLIQAMGGIMSLTGEPQSPPTKVGVGIADVMCGMYATVAILAALQHRQRSELGQHIDLALFDTQIAWLINSATNYLTSGVLPRRFGNGHPNVVPYQVFPTQDGDVVIAVGNDDQFKRACQALGAPELAGDPRFVTNSLRIENRQALIGAIESRTRRETTEHWVTTLSAAKVPVGSVNTLDRVFADPQAKHRQATVSMRHSSGSDIELLGNPIKMSQTPVSYRRPPPCRGEHTDEVLDELGVSKETIEDWRKSGVIE